MKNNLRLILFILFSILLIGCSKDSVFHDSQNHTIPLSSLRGKWIVINYWAAWCPSCIHEIPLLNHFYEENLNKNILIYGVNYDQVTGSNLNKTIQKEKIHFPILLENPADAFHLPFIERIPITFVINPEEKIIKIIEGPLTPSSLNEISFLLKNHA